MAHTSVFIDSILEVVSRTHISAPGVNVALQNEDSVFFSFVQIKQLLVIFA